MPALETLMPVSGILHFGTLIGSAQVPKELRFREELSRLSPLLRHWVLVAGGYIVFNLTAFGVISVMFSAELADGTPLARAFCAYVALFRACRLLIQFVVFDARPYLRNWFLRIGYHGLTLVFAWHSLVFGYSAIVSRG